MTKLLPPQEMHWPEDALFTLGHSTLPIESFVAVLRAYGIERLVDIRTMPRSRHNPQFNDTALAASLEAEHLQYIHMPALGGLRHARKDSPNTGWRNAGFRGYADYMLTEAFQGALEQLIEMSRRQRVAIMCAEAVPWRCHRSLVADALGGMASPWSRFCRRAVTGCTSSRRSRKSRECALSIHRSRLHYSSPHRRDHLSLSFFSAGPLCMAT
ncbi:MAG TPA: DUF488 domain-containing protein [Bradyrhizobium sp.]|jgi:hypothetical protein|uniref:DUF488 domain-containing protein n=1 Tax=Bradyrhizobium sp. TaxID=376 RepID=UPI002C6AC84D|nr:DUF488 domain-containing protein [Bradyrhizobium sp.]HTA99901.1 DUF488 domain-containing protein [Bradyrhizobium sp.]